MILLSDQVLLVIVSGLFVASIYYAIEHRDYVVGFGWTIPLVGLIYYYLFFSLSGIEILGDTNLRLAIVRPSLVGFFLMALVHILNGRVNQLITRITQRLYSWTHKHFKISSS